MYESLKNLILHKAYASREDAEARVRKAYPKWITEAQRYELTELIGQEYTDTHRSETPPRPEETVSLDNHEVQA